MQFQNFLVEGRLVSVDSDEGKERLKWEKPYVFRPFPQMLYLAVERPDGKLSVSETEDYLFARNGKEEAGAAERWTTNHCQKIVNNEAEKAKWMGLGWRETQAEALERGHARQKELSNITAQRHYEDRNMSDAAKAEAKAADDATADQVPEVPVKRRGRPRKVQAA